MHLNLVDKDAVLRFQTAVETLCLSGERRILLAVSGGPDSVAMLLLAHAAFPGHIAVATVNHGLRPEAADEAGFVARLCGDLGLEHVTLAPDQPITGNIQSAARVARYALLEQAADQARCDVIATAHHKDDQLETLLMRLARGSGLDGLAGVRATNGRVIRPVLGFAKAELEQICADAGVEPVRDPSNDDDDFDRVAMRQFLAERRHPFDATRAARSASALAEAGEALDWVLDRLSDERIVMKGDSVVVDPSNLPRELQRRLLLAALHKIAPQIAPRGDAIDRLLGDLHAGKTAMIGDILCKGTEGWRFSPAPPRRSV